MVEGGGGGGQASDSHNVSNVKIDTCIMTSDFDPLENELTLG